MTRAELRSRLADMWVSLPFKYETELLRHFKEPVMDDENHPRWYTDQDISVQLRKKVTEFQARLVSPADIF